MEHTDTSHGQPVFSTLQKDQPKYTRRKVLSPLTRFFIIALWGAALACLTFYGLSKLGY
jgi:hypothetical protein